MPAPPPAPLAPLPGRPDPGTVLDRFLAVQVARGLTLYPEQEEAILALYDGQHVLLGTPTGSGKSLVAAALHFLHLCSGRRTVYTCPIKALVNEKFLALCRDFGPDQVGMMTGDATVNPHAPVLCCTAEILANLALAHGADADFAAVILDEFHYYADPERGWAWQVPLLTLSRARFLLMSATLGRTDFFEQALTRLTGAPAVTVRSDRRPVPLTYEYSETPLQERLAQLLHAGQAPVYLVHFTQRAAAEAAQALMSLNPCSREEKAALAASLERVRFNSPYGREMKRWLRHGIGVHHAGLLPKYRILVEQLAQQGRLKLICGTDTLGVGINVPIRTVVFTQLWKYDGRKAAILSVRDFRQMAGRAGRAGYDTEGRVVVQAPEPVIEARRAAARATADPGRKKSAARPAPPPGAIGWDVRTFERLRTAPPEELVSRFAVTHGLLLPVLSRDADGCRALQRLLRDCHEPPARQAALRRRAWQLFRALLDRRIVEIVPREPSGRHLRVHVDLQADFSLHQALSLYLIDTLAQLDPAGPDYAGDVLTLCEAIVEDPEQILRRQVDRLRTEKLAELKAAGVPYEERLQRLEEIVEPPQPLREFLYGTFNAFAAAHPWVGPENIRPKSIAREMYERYLPFSAYVRDYGLERSEGLLLRHLTQTYKVLAQTVPDTAKTEPVVEMELYLRELIRGVDSSLLEEWERLRDPGLVAAAAAGQPARPASLDVTRDPAAFRRLVRTAILGFLQEVAARDWEGAAGRLTLAPDETPETPPPETALLAAARRIERDFTAHAGARGRFLLDPEGRAASHTHFPPTGGASATGDAVWPVAQVLIDPAGLNDWEARFTVALGASRRAGAVALDYTAAGPIGQR